MAYGDAIDLTGLRLHAARVRHQLGRRLAVGGRSYRVRGYVPTPLATDLRHEPGLGRVITMCLAMSAGAFVDVGANVGQTLLKVLAADPDRTYLGIEPQLDCCFFLDQFLHDNQLSGRAQVLSVALSDRNGMVELHSTRAHDELASIASDTTSTGAHHLHRRWVPARVGDEVLHEVGITDVAVIKIDVEGAELAVLDGLAATIARTKPAVIFEVRPSFTEYHTARPVPYAPEAAAANRAWADELHEWFDRAGYEIRQIDDRGDERAIDRFELDDPSRFVGSNFIARARA